MSMKRGAEKASSLGDDRSREVVTMILSLDLVLMNFRVAEVFCEDKFSDAVVVRGFESGLCVCAMAASKEVPGNNNIDAS